MKWNRSVIVAGMTFVLGMPLVATAEDRPDVPGIVDEARVVEEGKGKLTYRAKEKGQVWLYDTETRRPLHSMSVNADDTYTVDPKDDRVEFNDKSAGKFDLSSDRTYQIFFVTAEARDRKHAEPEKDRRSHVPATAKPVAEGRDRDLSYEAREAGTVYLYNASDHKLLTTFRLQQGQRLTVSPPNAAISLEGKRIADDVKLNREQNYQLLFDAGDADGREAGRDDRRDDRPDTARVPDNAKVVAEGKDRDLSYEARERGTVYLWNSSDNKLITTFNLDQGQRLTVAPPDNAISLEGKRIADNVRLDRDTNYKLLFVPRERAADVRD